MCSVSRRVVYTVTYEIDQCNSECTNLLDYSLGCAICACRDNPIADPPDTEDTARGLHNIVYKERELQCGQDQPSTRERLRKCGVDHVYASRALQ